MFIFYLFFDEVPLSQGAPKSVSVMRNDFRDRALSLYVSRNRLREFLQNLEEPAIITLVCESNKTFTT